MTEEQRQANIDKYAPGSDEAHEAGCTCPVIDNAYGDGAWGGIKVNGKTLYWMRGDCPLHGYDEEERYASYRMGAGG